MTVEELFENMKNCALFMGKYDAKHGSEEFMNGISTVMEYIASTISEETYEDFTEKFCKNIVDSQSKMQYN